jgi:hypothetical protein
MRPAGALGVKKGTAWVKKGTVKKVKKGRVKKGTA